MTPGETPLYEKGKTYKPLVLFASQKEPCYINVQMKDGACFKVEVSGLPLAKVRALKDRFIELVCTEVTDRGPEFALAQRYYESPPPAIGTVRPTQAPTRGSNIGLVEGPTVEFKKSLVFSPQTHQPNSDQPFEIAKEIAAFMNTSGGDLYLGVNDNGFVTGIENDLPHLGEAPIMMDTNQDENYSYKPNPDGFMTKLTTAIRCYLGAASAALVNPVDVLDDPGGTGLQYVRVHVQPSPNVIYLGRDESVVYRAQTSVLYLKGRQREMYVSDRFYRNDGAGADAEHINALLAKIDAQAKAIAEMRESIQKAMLAGEAVPALNIESVSIPTDSSIPLDKPHLDVIRSPSGLVFDGAFKGEAKTWGDLFARLLETLAQIDPDKFETLPDEQSFVLKGGRRVFARKGSHAKLDKSSQPLGRDKNVRADLAVGSKSSFLQAKGIPIRLIRHFGLKPEQFRIWTGGQ